jgi:Ca2+-binding RTX toxin-like protein
MAVFFGTIFNDNIFGTIFNDTFVGSNGNDRFNGGSGFDTADYSNLRTFFAAPQSITILPTGGILKGSLGSDQLTSVERIIANPFASNNLIDASTAAAPSFIDVDLSTSRLTVRNVPFLGTLNFTVNNFDDVSGTNQNDLIRGDSQNNRLRGNGGNDSFFGTTGNDTLEGGTGNDTADYRGLGRAITVKPTGIVEKRFAGVDDTISMETIIADPLVGGNTIDSSTASLGASLSINLSTGAASVSGPFPTINRTFLNFDDVIGTSGNDTITGDFQANILNGGGGNDTFFGTKGNDTLNGGTGNDTADYRGLGTAITVKPTGIVEKGLAGVDDTISMETIIADPLVGGNTIDSSTASLGASLSINLSTGGASVFGPFPTINRTFLNFDDVIGTSGNDTITGDSQNNVLNGGGGNDLISASGGNDTLVGGFGADTLTGGTGTNTFIYDSRFEGVDLITDFVSVDRINLRSSGFAGLSLGSLAASRYGEGSSLSVAAGAAFFAGSLFGAAILSVDTAAGVQVWYTSNTFNTLLFGTDANLLATLSSTSTSLATLNQSNFSVIA